MSSSRPITFMVFALSCAFSLTAVFGVIILPSFLPESVILTPPSSFSLAQGGNPPIAQDVTVDSSVEALAKTNRSSEAIAHLLFAGDIMLARGVESTTLKKGLNYPLSDVTPLISSADLAIANFEGTIQDEQHIEPSGFTFDTTPAIAGIVPAAGFDVVSLSNNHSDNHGATIVKHTRDTLTSLGVTPFGDPYESGNFVAHKTLNGTTFAFIGFHAFGEDSSSIIPTIETEKSAGNFVIVFPHWGVEYSPTPSITQIESAHAFIDAGADAIIGAHPHVIESYENYHGVPIIYSLGNFLFDQDWSIPTQQGLVLGFDLDATSITLTFTPITIHNQKTTLMAADAASAVLSNNNLPSILKIPRVTNQKTEEPPVSPAASSPNTPPTTPTDSPTKPE